MAVLGLVLLFCKSQEN